MILFVVGGSFGLAELMQTKQEVRDGRVKAQVRRVGQILHSAKLTLCGSLVDELTRRLRRNTRYTLRDRSVPCQVNTLTWQALVNQGIGKDFKENIRVPR